MVTIPQSHLDLFEKRSFAQLGTVDEDGMPHVTPVWVAYDGTHILINSARGRKKDRNLRERPYVAMSIPDPEDPYRYLGVQGIVSEITEEGAEEMINDLAHKYFGRDYPYVEGEVRVIYKITPTNVWAMK